MQKPKPKPCYIVNAHKTGYMSFNQTGDISTLNISTLKLVDQPREQCLTNRDRHQHATSQGKESYYRPSVIWKSDLTDKMKRSFFPGAIVSILDSPHRQWLNRWRKSLTTITPITKTIKIRRTRHAGQCWRSRDKLVSDVDLWTPSHGRAKSGRPAITYIQQLRADTGCSPEDMLKAMDASEAREGQEYPCS